MVSKRTDTYHIARASGDSTFLNWLADRLVNVYHEDENTDFVRTLRDFAKEVSVLVHNQQKIVFIEVRDRLTCIPAVAIQFVGKTPAQVHLLGVVGFTGASPSIVLMRLSDQEAHSDPYDWKDIRTMGRAHVWIEENFNSLENGDVVDVEYILGETTSPKSAEWRDRWSMGV